MFTSSGSETIATFRPCACGDAPISFTAGGIVALAATIDFDADVIVFAEGDWRQEPRAKNAPDIDEDDPALTERL